MPSAHPLTFLGISGSLRSGSSNTALLRAMAKLARRDISFSIFGELELVPPFNPEKDNDDVADVVKRFREQVRRADAVFFSTPEYAHGVPGVLKNALDWLVGSGEFVEKPVAIVRPAPRGEFALASLQETLTVMSARLIPQAAVTLSFTTNRLNESDLLADAPTVQALTSAIDAMRAAIRG